MARVLFVVPIGQDMGGIITSTEQYVLGLREAGHRVTPICVVFTSNDPAVGSSPRGKFADDYVPGPGTGWPMHPTAGWRGEARVSLLSEFGMRRFCAMAKQADVIVWASLYGLRNDATEGFTYWLAAIKAGKGKNVFMIHDDHLPERYPWAGALAPWARAFVGVQPCSYDSLSSVAAPRAMVYTPLPPPPARVPSLAPRTGWLSCQVWKTWKRGDALVAAAPYLPKGSVTFAGDGIQLRYMRSKDKCPPRYAGMWDAAMETQNYAGVLSEAERDNAMRRSKFLVDLSARDNSGQLNRVVQEAMAQGCVVIANPKFIPRMFEPFKHYLPVFDSDYAPKELAAKLLTYSADMSEKRYAALQKAARGTLHRFNRAELGAQLVSLGLGKEDGLFYQRNPGSNVDLGKAQAAFKEVFGDAR